jgi:hypothetical protein
MAQHFTGGVAPLTEHLVDRGVIAAADATERTT